MTNRPIHPHLYQKGQLYLLPKRGAGPALLSIATGYCFPVLMSMGPALPICPGEGCGARSVWPLMAVHSRDICLVVVTDPSYCRTMNPEIGLHGSMGCDLTMALGGIAGYSQ